jgi:hypothetical protein
MTCLAIGAGTYPLYFSPLEQDPGVTCGGVAIGLACNQPPTADCELAAWRAEADLNLVARGWGAALPRGWECADPASRCHRATAPHGRAHSVEHRKPGPGETPLRVGSADRRGHRGVGRDLPRGASSSVMPNPVQGSFIQLDIGWEVGRSGNGRRRGWGSFIHRTSPLLLSKGRDNAFRRSSPG